MTTQSTKKSVQLFFTAYLNDSSVLQKDGKINPTGGAKAVLIAPTVNPSLRNGAQDASHSARGGLNTKELGQSEFIDGYYLTKIPNKNYKPDSESEEEIPSHVYEMKWSKHVGCDFLFEAKQPLGIALTSKDGGTRYAITEKDFLLSQVICSSARSKSYPLLSTLTNLVVGVITVTYVDKCVNAKDALYLQFHAGGLSKVDTRKNAIPNSLLPLHILEPSGKPNTTSPFSDQDPIKPYWVIHRILPNGGLSKVAQTSTAVTKVHGQSPTFVWPVIGPILLSDVGTANAEEITILVECRYVKWKKNGGENVNFELDPLIGSYATSVAAISEGFAVKGPAAQLGQTPQTTSRSFPLFAPLTTEKTAGGGFCCGDGAVATKSDKYKAINQGYSAISVFSTKTDRHSQSDRVSVGSVLYTPESYLYKCPNFTDYLSAGWQINLAVSIDFTGSNGNPREPTSLHYIPADSRSKKEPNHYIRAIMSVGDILLEYDDDKLVPLYGFGAALGSRGRGEDFFSVREANERRISGNQSQTLLGEQTTSNHEHANVDGVQGILNEYGSFLPTCELSGPTNFAPTIRAATRLARQGVNFHSRQPPGVAFGDEGQINPPVYTILLIITDGEITDMRETIDALVEADDAPLSIVIVGVGNNCDFEAMVELDCDGSFLQHRFPANKSRISRRDLVQFVPFRDFEHKSRESLAAEVLEEVPEQFEVFAELSGARPRMSD